MRLRDRNFIPEFSFKTSRSSGAGGQHVNTTETKVELVFDVSASALLSLTEKEKITRKLSGYINDRGELRVNSSQSRSQSANKEQTIEKFYELLEKALKREKKRIPTKIPESVKEEILRRKKLHARKKTDRRFKARDFM